MNDITREEFNARLEIIETRMDGRLSSIEQMIGAKFAEFESTFRRAMRKRSNGSQVLFWPSVPPD